MSDLPKKLQERIEELAFGMESAVPDCDSYNGDCRRHGALKELAQELYADLELAMEALEKVDNHGENGCKAARGYCSTVYKSLREKYKGDE